MHLVPSEEEILEIFVRTGALREGHFAYANGVHTNQHVDPALATRSYENAKILTVALSRQLRGNSELAAILPQLSLVAATPSGLPAAYGLAEALRPHQVYWAEKPDAHAPMRFPPFVGPRPGEKVVLVDDILRSGQLLSEAKGLLEAQGAIVLALAVFIQQPTPKTIEFAPLPVFSLLRLDPRSYSGPDACELCRRGFPLRHMGRDWKLEESPEPMLTPAQ
jgi:orotate phosphoribosyltransferase